MDRGDLVKMYNWPGPAKRPRYCTHWTNSLVILQSRQTEEFVILGINFARRFAMKKLRRRIMAAASSGPADPEVLYIGGQTYNIKGLHVPIARLAFLPCSICGPSYAGIAINCSTMEVGCVDIVRYPTFRAIMFYY